MKTSICGIDALGELLGRDRIGYENSA